MTPRTAVVVATAAVGALLPFLPGVQSAEFATHDLRFALRPPSRGGPRVVVAAIDDRTLQAWPEPREFWGARLAGLLRRLGEAKARAVGLDLILAADADAFLEAKGVAEGDRPDQALAIELDRSPIPVWLATDAAGRDWGSQEFAVGAFRWASSSIPYGRRDTVRQLDRADRGVPTLADALAGAPGRIGGAYWIDYDRRPIPVLSATDVASGAVPAEALRGAVVLVGTTYTGNGDVHDTPFGLRDGVAVQAEAVRTLLARDELRVPPSGATALLGGLVGSLCGGLAMARSWSRYAAACLLGGAAYLGLAFAAFLLARWMVPVAAPLAAALLAVPLISYPVREVQRRLDLERSEADRARIRARWGQMIDDRFVEYVESRQGAGLGALGTVEAAFLFLDVADFSLKSIRLSPEAMLGNLNRMFDALVPTIQEAHGIVLAFTGDGLACAFDEREGEADARERALSVALAVLSEVERLNAADAFAGGEWKVRLGLASGPVTLALVGSERRQTVTFYGEAVNLASRLEQAGKALGASLVVSESYVPAAAKRGLALESHALAVKGWEGALTICTPVRDSVPSPSPLATISADRTLSGS